MCMCMMYFLYILASMHSMSSYTGQLHTHVRVCTTTRKQIITRVRSMHTTSRSLLEGMDRIYSAGVLS